MAVIYTMGEILVEIMRESVDTPLGRTGRFLGPYPSGAPAIFISAAAQLGHRTRIWGGVGRDKFGRCLLERLESDGVDCRLISQIDGRATAVAFVAYDSAGEREFIYHIDGTPATAFSFSPQDAPTPDYFHVMGCSLMAGDSMRENINKAVTFYAGDGSKISFDPNIRPELLGSRSVWELAGTVMERCSIFLPGVDELRLFGDAAEVEDCVSALFKRFSKLEIIHLKKGKRGSQIFTREERIDIPLFPIEQVRDIVDPTGAGDSFDGAFICALAEGKNLRDAGAWAAKAGALNSAEWGPMGGSMKEIHDDILP